MSPGVWTMRDRPRKFRNGTLTGMQFASGLSFRKSCTRLQAHGFGPGLNVPGLQFLGDVVVETVLAGPTRSPDAGQVRLAVCVLGTGAARFGLPSASRGMPGVGKSIHCAVSDADIATMSAAVAAEHQACSHRALRYGGS